MSKCECTKRNGMEPLGGDSENHVALIRLLVGCEGEESATADCGCHLVREEDGDVALFQCATHTESHADQGAL